MAVVWPERIQIGKEDTAKIYFGDFSCPGNNIVYALRFKKDNVSSTDNSLLAAYKYELLDVTNAGSGENWPNLRLVVTVRYLGEDFTGTIADIANEEFWQQKGDDAVRVFPAGGAGFITENGQPALWVGEPRYQSGYFMSSSFADNDYFPQYNVEKKTNLEGIMVMRFGHSSGFPAKWGGGIINTRPSDIKMCVRCVSDK